jgi:hypothetical protein
LAHLATTFWSDDYYFSKAAATKSAVVLVFVRSLLKFLLPVLQRRLIVVPESSAYKGLSLSLR